MKNILLSNDDGIDAPGLVALYGALKDIANVYIVAPDKNQSGKSSAITLSRPIRVRKIKQNIFSTDANPADCVHLALNGFLDIEFDLVISGINAGANLGDDTIYSGTLGAAIEGRFLNYPAIAVSNVNSFAKHFASSALFIKKLIFLLQKKNKNTAQILNINIPDIPFDKIEQVKFTSLGVREKSNNIIKEKDPRGLDIYWIGKAAKPKKIMSSNDFGAIEQNAVSISPIDMNLTGDNSKINLNLDELNLITN